MCSLMSHWAWRGLESWDRRLQSENTSEQGRASALLSFAMTFFFFLVCLLPPTYMLSSFVHCLPAWIWNANNLHSARNILTLFHLSVYPSPLLTFVCLPHFLCVFSSSLPLFLGSLDSSVLSEFLGFLSVSQGQSFVYHIHISTVGKRYFLCNS